MTWDAGLYEQFARARHEAFDHLMARVPPLRPTHIIDAGCGTGRTTHDLARRYPDADVLGIDASAAMLAQARASGRVAFQQADLRTFAPAPTALVVANASLHWVPEPAHTLQHLASWLAPGGVLAVQVPANHDAPSHRLARRVAREMGLDIAWGDHVLGLAAMAHALEDAGCTVDAWDHVMVHELDGHDAVLRWLEGTTLRPVMAGPAYDMYRARLAPLLRAAYPTRGRTSFTFRRRYAVAVKGPASGPV